MRGVGFDRGPRGEFHDVERVQGRDDDWDATLLVDGRYQEETTGNHVYESQGVHERVLGRRGPARRAGAAADRAGRSGVGDQRGLLKVRLTA